MTTQSAREKAWTKYLKDCIDKNYSTVSGDQFDLIYDVRDSEIKAKVAEIEKLKRRCEKLFNLGLGKTQKIEALKARNAELEEHFNKMTQHVCELLEYSERCFEVEHVWDNAQRDLDSAREYQKRARAAQAKES